MGAQSDVLWSCTSRKVKATKLAMVAGRSWWLTISLDCGHDAIQEYPFRANLEDPLLRSVASNHAKDRAIRAETNIKRVGTCPCMACGPDPA